MWDSGTVLMTSPRTKICPLPLPDARRVPRRWREPPAVISHHAIVGPAGPLPRQLAVSEKSAH
jgi:hypothetical protein